MTIGEVREMASVAAHRGDHRLADLLHREAATRVQIAIQRHTADGRQWWPSVTEIPIGLEFVAVSPHCDTSWRREIDGCRALPPIGSGRVYATWLIDQAWSAEGHGFAEASTATKQIARQHQ